MVWLIVSLTAGTATALAAFGWLAARRIRKRRAAADARRSAGIAADAMRLYQTARDMAGPYPELPPRDQPWPGGDRSPLGQPRPGAMAYFSNRMHDHRPGHTCLYCNWPARD